MLNSVLLYRIDSYCILPCNYRMISIIHPSLHIVPVEVQPAPILSRESLNDSPRLRSLMYVGSVSLQKGHKNDGTDIERDDGNHIGSANLLQSTSDSMVLPWVLYGFGMSCTVSARFVLPLGYPLMQNDSRLQLVCKRNIKRYPKVSPHAGFMQVCLSSKTNLKENLSVVSLRS